MPDRAGATMAEARRVVVLSGGVGGARFLHGVARALPAEAVTAIVNTGDDLEHWGLRISPDLDTVMYTLADLADEARGWGLVGETFEALGMVRRYGGDDWFQLGDRDLGTHLVRTQALARGATLAEVTARLCAAVGVGQRVLPMADGPCRTMIDTDEHGALPFQDWFVRLRTAPEAKRVWFDGAPPPAPGVLAAIEAADLVLFGPSNPYVSIDPILARPGVREALARKRVVAVSPIVGGQAVKGPLATMIATLAGEPPSAAAVARHYGGLLAGMVVERGDEAAFAEDAALRGLPVLATDTIMRSKAERLRLARETLAFAGRVGSGSRSP
jgi:LPPG:FO 2-phospho-L-lactate transferase